MPGKPATWYETQFPEKFRETYNYYRGWFKCMMKVALTFPQQEANIDHFYDMIDKKLADMICDILEDSVKKAEEVRLVEVFCKDCDKSFFVKRQEGTWFYPITGGVERCPFCGSKSLRIDPKEVEV